MFDPNVMVTSIIKNMLLGVNSVVSNIPWWLWLIFIVSSVLTKKKSRRRKWGYR
jgi:type II secretory pathway component PulF